MKQLFGILTLIFILVASIVILQSCTKNVDDDPNCDDQIQNYYLSEKSKAAFPYSAYDTITLISNFGDTIHCIGGEKTPFTTSEFQRYSNPACGNRGTTIYYEAYKLRFYDSIKKISIELNHYERIFFPSKFITQEQSNTFSFSFKNTNFYIGDLQLSDSRVQGYQGNLNINGTIYKDVTKLSKDYIDSTSTMLVNKTDGIIQINLIQNEIWTTIK